MSNKFHIKYVSEEERISAWKKNRILYDQWRKTSEARTFIEWKRKKQQELCFICVLPLDEMIHVDHVFPLYLGGTNFKGNLCITHPKCNMDKGAKVYYSYKQACHRRRRFNLMRKAKRAKERLARNPKAILSKKDFRAIKIVYGKI